MERSPRRVIEHAKRQWAIGNARLYDGVVPEGRDGEKLPETELRMDEARRLVLRYGWNATAYQILNPGIEHWFASRSPGVVGFVPRARMWVAAGAPVCAKESLAEVAGEFEASAAARRRKVCYFLAAGRLAEHFRDSPRHTTVAVGAQPVWDPRDWEGILRGRKSLRAQLSRARNKGVEVREAPAESARGDPELRRCLARWVESRPLPPLHFLTEPWTIDGPLEDRRLFVAERDGGGGATAFLLASPVPTRNGFLVEQIARCPDAPNGTAELLIDAAMRTLAGEGATYLTMGTVALSTHARAALRQNPWWVRGLMAWARAHGRRFYHFEGLEQFRSKMCPRVWEPLYAISNERRFTPRTLHAMLAAFAEGSLAGMVGRALVKAVVQEARWLAGG